MGPKVLILGDIGHALNPEGNCVIKHIIKRIGAEVVSNPDDGWDIGFLWESNGNAYAENRYNWPQSCIGRSLYNSAFTSNRKIPVERVFSDVFGYGFHIDPTTYPGKYVKKSDVNAAHDGQVLDGPTERTHGYVYQKLINNSVNEDFVEDIRLPYLNGQIPFVYRKIRPSARRFENFAATASIESVSSLLTPSECVRILRFCRRMGLDYGELDVLRNRDDGRIYIVDVNNTPWGPPSPLKEYEGEGKIAMDIMADCFLRSMVDNHAGY